MLSIQGTGLALPSPLLYPILAETMGGKEVICDMSTKGVKPDWVKFHEWERRYTREKLKKLTPTERIKIVENLYITALKVREYSKKLKKEKPGRADGRS